MTLKHKYRLHPISFLFLPLLLYPGNASGEMYKWTDKNGTIHFSDTLEGIPAEELPKVQKRALVSSGNITEPDKPIIRDVKMKKTEASKKEIRVSYQAYDGTSSRIIIQVTFNGSVTAPMLLDTGAPGMMITSELADRIGLFDKDEGKLFTRSGGIGGEVPSILTIVDNISVGDATASFLPTQIADASLSPAFQGLVGMDFMANYDLQVDSENEVLIFKELPPNSGRPAGRNERWWRSKFRDFSTLRNVWERYLSKLEKISPNTTELERIKKVTRHQVAESAKLYERLERYASQNSVPRSWRE